MVKSDFVFILKSFLIWRVGIIIVTILAVKFVPLFSHNFLGGGYSTYINNPIFWGNLNFDGEHYLAISTMGYQPLTYFYFPLFPLLVRFLSFSNEIKNIALTGILVSNLSFFIALIGIFKLVELDYKKEIAKLTVILFLVFPTSFYFGAYYTESLFLALSVWGFYLIRKQKILFASIITALLSSTRVIGVVLAPVLLLEFIKNKNYKIRISNLKEIWPIILAPTGILYYMYYLYKQTGDPLNFLNTVSIFGQQRSSTFILLPQVFYRYIFKIIPNISYQYFPNVFTTYLEFASGAIVLMLIIYGFFKLRISYSVYTLIIYLIPTLSGSFSSMPRYVLVIFPTFILMGVFINKMPKIYRYMIFSVMILLLVISTAMFWRGYWIS